MEMTLRDANNAVEYDGGGAMHIGQKADMSDTHRPTLRCMERGTEGDGEQHGLSLLMMESEGEDQT